MTDEKAFFDRIAALVQEHGKIKGAVSAQTRFADDLELDSLTVMDIVAAIEDEWDIILPLNMLPELETVGQLVDAVARLVEKAGQSDTGGL